MSSTSPNEDSTTSVITDPPNLQLPPLKESNFKPEVSDCLKFSNAFQVAGFETVNDQILREMNKKAQMQLRNASTIDSHTSIFGSTGDSASPQNTNYTPLSKRMVRGNVSPSKRRRDPTGQSIGIPNSPTPQLSNLNLNEKERLIKVSDQRRINRIQTSPRRLGRPASTTPRSAGLGANNVPKLQFENTPNFSLPNSIIPPRDNKTRPHSAAPQLGSSKSLSPTRPANPSSGTRVISGSKPRVAPNSAAAIVSQPITPYKPANPGVNDAKPSPIRLSPTRISPDRPASTRISPMRVSPNKPSPSKPGSNTITPNKQTPGNLPATPTRLSTTKPVPFKSSRPLSAHVPSSNPSPRSTPRPLSFATSRVSPSKQAEPQEAVQNRSPLAKTQTTLPRTTLSRVSRQSPAKTNVITVNTPTAVPSQSPVDANKPKLKLTPTDYVPSYARPTQAALRRSQANTK